MHRLEDGEPLDSFFGTRRKIDSSSDELDVEECTLSEEEEEEGDAMLAHLVERHEVARAAKRSVVPCTACFP